MAKTTLPTNYKDDILNASMNGKRRYNLIQNSDGTYSLEDVSTYDQVGSEFTAANMNATNKNVNESADKNKIVKDMETIDAITEAGYIPDALALKEVNNSLINENNESFNFGIKNGVRGFFTNPSRADDSFVPFKGTNSREVVFCGSHNNSSGNVSSQPYVYISVANYGIPASVYQNLTISNFLLVVPSDVRSAPITYNVTNLTAVFCTAVATGYNASTGVLTVRNPFINLSLTQGITTTAFHCYCVY